MKKILIPIDFKYNRHDAIEYAINFFKNENCHFYFFNTYTYDIEGLNTIHLLQADADWFEKPGNESEKQLGDLIKTYTSNHPNKNHRFNAISECSNLIDGIKKTIVDIGIDLVIIPRKKEIESATQRYSKNSKSIIENIRECPVMVIPDSAKL